MGSSSGASAGNTATPTGPNSGASAGSADTPTGTTTSAGNAYTPIGASTVGGSADTSIGASTSGGRADTPDGAADAGVVTQPNDAQAAADITTSGIALEAGTVPVDAAGQCPSISMLSIEPSELLGSQQGQLSVSVQGAYTAIHWTHSPCAVAWSYTPCNVDVDAGTPCDFVGTDGGPATDDTTVQFTCGPYLGTVSVSATVSYLQTQPDAMTPVDVCLGAPSTTITGFLNCEGDGILYCLGSTPDICCDAGQITCANLGNDTNNCGACGNVCPQGVPCVNRVCGAPH
jgi:hypothetical protein